MNTGVECVYVIYDAQKRPVRIGETGDLRRRLLEYEKNYWWWKSPTAVTFAYFLIEGGEKNRQKFEKLATRLVGEHAIFNEQNRLIVPELKVSRGKRVRTPTGYTGKRVSAFLLGDERHDVDNWRGVLTKICELAYRTAPDEFAKKTLTLKGKRRPYFSHDGRKPSEGGELRDGMEIRDSGVYVESNLSADAIVKLATKILHLFQMPADFKIIAE